LFRREAGNGVCCLDMGGRDHTISCFSKCQVVYDLRSRWWWPPFVTWIERADCRRGLTIAERIKLSGSRASGGARRDGDFHSRNSARMSVRSAGPLCRPACLAHRARPCRGNAGNARRRIQQSGYGSLVGKASLLGPACHSVDGYCPKQPPHLARTFWVSRRPLGVSGLRLQVRDRRSNSVGPDVYLVAHCESQRAQARRPLRSWP